MPDSLVAIVNSHTDTVNLLREHLEREGFRTVTGLVESSKFGLTDLIKLLKQHDPAVVIFNIATSNEAEWAMVKLIMDFEAKKGRCFVLTTTSQTVVARLTTNDPVHELIQKPQDFEALTHHIKELLASDH
jgi:DNA-binding NtrC family response regulator